MPLPSSLAEPPIRAAKRSVAQLFQRQCTPGRPPRHRQNCNRRNKIPAPRPPPPALGDYGTRGDANQTAVANGMATFAESPRPAAHGRPRARRQLLPQAHARPLRKSFRKNLFPRQTQLSVLRMRRQPRLRRRIVRSTKRASCKWSSTTQKTSRLALEDFLPSGTRSSYPRAAVRW